MKYLITLSLILSSFFLILNKNIIQTHAVISYTMVGLLVAYYLYTHPERRLNLFWEKTLYLYMAFSILYYCGYGMLMSKMMSKWGLFSFLEISIFMVYYFILCQSLREDWLPFICKTVTFCIFLMATYMIIQRIGYDPLFKSAHPTYRAAGTLGNPTDAGSYLVVGLPFLFALRKKWWLLSLPIIVAVILSNSATAIGTLVIVGLLFLWLKGRKKIATISLIFCLIAVIFLIHIKPNFFNLSGREKIWLGALQYWMGSPYTIIRGYGLGSFKTARFVITGVPIEELSFYDTTRIWARPQNVWILVLFELGLIGLGLFTGFVYSILRKVPKDNISLCIYISVVASLIMASANITYHLWPVLMMVGLGTAILRIGGEKEWQR